jgi:hypothetical protein
MLLGLIALATTAHAGNWNKTVEAFPIKQTIDVPALNKYQEWHEIHACLVGANGCIAADAGQDVASDWSYIRCTSTLTTDSLGYDHIRYWAYFSAPSVNDVIQWPESWPSQVTCTRTFEAGHSHSFTIPIITSPNEGIGFSLPVTTVVTNPGNTTAITLSVAAEWETKLFVFNIPDADYTAPGSAVPLKTSVGGSNKPDTGCLIENQVDDYLTVVVEDAATSGTAYCQATLSSGATVWWKFQLSIVP